MFDLYLTPASISYLTLVILTTIISVYLIQRMGGALPDRRGRHILLVCVFVCIALLSLLFFLETSWLPSARLFAVYLENTVLGLGAVFMIQFAYRFPVFNPKHKWEAWAALLVSAGYTLYEANYALMRLQKLAYGEVQFRPEYADYWLVAVLFWLPVIFVRQAVRHWENRSSRAFVFIFLIPVALAVINLLRTYYITTFDLYHISLSVGLLFFVFIFVVNYLNALPESTSFQVKLSGATLTSMLAVLGAVGWVVAPEYAATYRPSLPDQRTLRFTPNAAGGYDVTQAPYHFDPDFGENLGIVDRKMNEAVPLKVDFSFFGKQVDEIYIRDDGVIGMGSVDNYPSYQYFFGREPAIFPLLIDLNPGSDSLSGVYLRQDMDRVIITWEKAPAFFHPQAIYTFQVILYADSTFDMTYHGLAGLKYSPNDRPEAMVWMFGIVKGGIGADYKMVDFSQLPLTGGSAGLVQDEFMAARRYLHEFLTPLALLILGASVVFLVGFPILLTSSLVRPLAALLRGVQEMNAGNRGIQTPVYYNDEIGYLTQSFNAMRVELDDFVKSLENRVAERTAELTDANERLRELSSAAEAANRAKSAFLANMSHELRTPLNAILGFTELMVRDSNLTDEQSHNLAIINRSGEHLLALINDILEISKIESGRIEVQRQSFDLHYMLQGLEEMFRLRAEQKGLYLRFVLEQDTPRYIQTDQGKLRQVLINLLGNAVKFTQQGGITLSVVRVKPCKDVEDGAIIPDELCLVFSVEDTGIGIGSADLDSIFNPFVQVESGRDVQQGTGLGLSICRQYIEMLGGQITVTSELGVGSIFAFDIPVTLGAEKTLPPLSHIRRVVGIEQGQPVYRILVVDDVATSRWLLVKLLQPLGFEVREAVNGKDALKVLANWKAHLIFMDIRMPVMDGYEAARRIRQKPAWDDVVVVALTSSAFAEDRQSILGAGCNEFVDKPYRQERIFEVMQRYLGVNFVYEDLTPSAQAFHDDGFDATALADGWKARMQHAANDGDFLLIQELIREIEPQFPGIARELFQVVYNFDYHRLLSILGIEQENR